ncbi:alpha/beta fold hydrolase [Cohnella laeviribosi]|uniref:alpha/beta fold hydrolase n=1 Tax=Cohnella laeviribosi TaxID=380174 RepID=UPI003D23603B
MERGVRIFVEDIHPAGGKTALFVHGWPVNHKMFEYQLNQLPRYGYRCIALDLRGFGQSDRPWTGYTYDRMADDIRVIIDMFRLRDFVLVGFSIGGAISIRYMARHQGHGVRRLALLSAAAPSFSQRPGYPYGQTREEVDALIRQTLTNRPAMLKGFGDQFFAQNHGPEFMNWFASLGLEASGHGTAQGLIALRDEDLRQDLSAIRVPTAIFAGVQDRIVLFQSALALQQGIPGSVLHRFEQSGHGVFYDELEAFNSRFFAFLNQPD